MSRWMVRFLLVSMIFQFGYVSTFAQRNKSARVLNYLQNNRYDKAKELVDELNQSSEYTVLSSTYYVRGMVYYALVADSVFGAKEVDSLLAESVSAYQRSLMLNTSANYEEDMQVKVLDGIVDLKKILKRTASKYYNRQAYDTSIVYWEYALSLDSIQQIYSADAMPYVPDNELYLYSGITYQQAGRQADAITQLNRLRTDFAADEQIYLRIARLYRQLTDTVSFQKTLNEGLSNCTDSANILRTELIAHYMETEDYEQSLEVARQAVNVDPKNDSVLFFSALVNEKAGNTDEAIRIYSQLIGLNSDFFEAEFNIGSIYYNKGINILEKAIYLSLHPMQLKEFEGKEKEALAQFKAALPYLEQAHELRPTDLETLYLLLTLYSKLQKYSQYEEVLDVLSKLH